MRPDFEFYTEPRAHQVQCIDAILQLKRLNVWMDIGLGKTLTSLYGLSLSGVRSFLVVCPNSVIRVWREQIQEHTNLSFVELTGERAIRQEKFEFSRGDVYIINFEGLRTLWAEKRAVSRGPTKGKVKYFPSKKIGPLPFDAIVFDESQGLSDHTTLQTQISHELSKHVDRVLHLTGTPDNGKLKGLWPQMWVLDGGRTLGYSINAYLFDYFSPRQTKYGTEWDPKPDSLDKVMARLAPVTRRYDRRDCIDLPELVTVLRSTDATTEQLGFKNAMVSNAKKSLAAHGLTMTDVTNVGAKLHQISSGFLLDQGNPVKLKTSSKMDLLEEVIESFSTKAIIFHTFVEEGRMIEDMLRRVGHGFASLRGEIKNKDAEALRFKEDADTRFLVAHPKSGGTGQNFQNANVIIFFSFYGISPNQLSQCIGRIHRTGQINNCTIIFLTVNSFPDEATLTALQNNVDQAQAILDWLRVQA